MFPTTENLDTELSAVNSVLAAIGQAPVTEINYDNPEVSLIANLIQECLQDLLNEGWSFNTERNFPMKPNADGRIPYPNNILRLDYTDNYYWREKDVVRRNGYVYDKIAHTDVFDKGFNADVVWAWAYKDIPPAFQRYVVISASIRAASQLVGSTELVSLLSQEKQVARATIMENECNQGDYTMFGLPDGSSYLSYQPFQALRRL